MDVSAPDSDWRSASHRQELVSKIEDAMRRARVAHNQSSNEMENDIFLSATSRGEYLSLVARLIIHFRDIYSKKGLAPASDQMNATQIITGTAPVGVQGMPMEVCPPGSQLGGIGGMPQMAHQMSLPGQLQPGASGMAPHGISGVSTGNQPTQLQHQ